MKPIVVATVITLILSVPAQVANSDGIQVFVAGDDIVTCTDVYRSTILGIDKYLVACAYDPTAKTADPIDFVDKGKVEQAKAELKPRAIAKLESNRKTVYTADETQALINGVTSDITDLTNLIETRIDDVFGEFSRDVLERVVSEDAVSAMRGELVAQLSGEISSLVALEIEAAKAELLQSDEFKNAVREALN